MTSGQLGARRPQRLQAQNAQRRYPRRAARPLRGGVARLRALARSGAGGGQACAGDLAHVLLAGPCAELAAVRGPWLADVESALRDAALGGWWAGLPATIDGRGRRRSGGSSIVEEAPQDATRPIRAELTRVFLRHFGAWWARAGDGAVARLAVH